MKNPFTVFRQKKKKKVNNYKRKRRESVFPAVPAGSRECWPHLWSAPSPAAAVARGPRAAALPARPTAPPGAAGRARSGRGESGETRPQGGGCGPVGGSPSVGHEQLQLCEAPERRAELTAPDRRRCWPWARHRPRQCPAGAGSGAAPPGACTHERAALCRRDTNSPSSGMVSPSPGHSGAMGGFPLARHSLECLRKPGRLLLWLKDGALQRGLPPWPLQGSLHLPQKDILTAEFPPQNLLIKGSEWLGKFMLPHT